MERRIKRRWFKIFTNGVKGLPIVSEIMDSNQINELTMDCIDIVQVGTRNSQNYTLLDPLGELDIPILLKRGTLGNY